MPLRYHQETRELLNLPNEILRAFLKAQLDIKDAIHLGATCSRLHSILRENSMSIAIAILKPKGICAPDDQALLLIKTDLSSSASDLIKTMSSMLLDAPIVLDEAGKFFTREVGVVFTPEDNRTLLPHERLRILHCWYFLKQYARSVQVDKARSKLDKQICKMSALHVYILWEMCFFLTQELGPAIGEVLEIENPDPPPEEAEVEAHCELPEWLATMYRMATEFDSRCDMGEYDRSAPVLCGPCDPTTSHPRDPAKGIWEL